MARTIAAAILLAASLSGCQAPSGQDGSLQGAAHALEALGALPPERAAPGKSASSDDAATPARELLARIDRYAASERTGAPAIAAWFALYDDYRKLPQAQAEAVADPRTGEFLSVTSLLAVVPGPTDWQAMREQARARAAAKSGNADDRFSAQALVLLFDALLYDLDAQAKSLQELRRAADATSKERQQQALPLIQEWRDYLAYDASVAQTPAPVPAAVDQAEAADAGANDPAPTAAAAEPAQDATMVAERLQRALSTSPETKAADAVPAAVFERATAALKLAELGTLEKRSDWMQQGLGGVHKILGETRAAAYAAGGNHDADDRERTLSAGIRVLRAAGRAAEAERLLFDELAAIGATCRGMTASACRERFAAAHGDLAARLLLAVYAASGNDAQVRELADRYPLWASSDAAQLSVDLGFPDHEQPALAIAHLLVSSGHKDDAARLLRGLAAQAYRVTPAVARQFGATAGDEAVGAALQMRQHAAGPRNAIAALAAAGAGLWPRAQELALAARREQLYAPWRAAMDEVLAGAAQAAGDAAAAARWNGAAQAQARAARASRYAQIGVSAKAGADFATALASAQPGDCVENSLLELARQRKDAAQVATSLQHLAHNAQSDDTGGAVGCLKEYLSLAPADLRLLRRALTTDATQAVPAFREDIAYVIDRLDNDCNLYSRANLDRTCVEPAQLARDARAAYADIKSHLRPWDMDAVEVLDRMARRSAFPSLYAGHLDHAPDPPTITVSAFERDDWPIRLVKLEPVALPAAVQRKQDADARYWAPVVHLFDYWFFAHGAAARLAPASTEPAYMLQAASTFGPAPAAPRVQSDAAPRDPSLSANLLVAGTEIVQTALRLIEPGRHDPCTTCP